MKPTLAELLTTEEANTIEHYFCPEDIDENSNVLACSWNQLPRLPLWCLKSKNEQELVEYSYRNLVYQYDTSNDSQRAFQKHWITDAFHRKEYTVVFQEDFLPSHRFPCSNEIDNKQRYQKIQYKINNRIFMVIEKTEDSSYTLYLKYNHAPQADIVKMQEEWDSAYAQIAKAIYAR